MAEYIFDDEVFTSRDKVTGTPTGKVNGESFETFFGPRGKYLGHAICSQPFEMYTSLNPTTPPGVTAGVWTGLMFQLGKWEYNGVKRISESIDVTPAYSQYYQMTIHQKEEIEGKIKAGLQSVSQTVADLELLKHDQRKYKEFLDYFGLTYNPDAEDGKEWDVDEKKKKEVNEHALKSIFIDQVDAHTGDSVAMRNIVSRWPTLITDFMRLGPETDVEKIAKELDVSKAEGVVLSSKNRLYQEWKTLFEPEMKSRFAKITELVRSRETSLHEYRDWMKPLIAKHKIMGEILEEPGGRNMAKTLHFYTQFQALSVHATKVWAWRFYTATEFFRAAGSEQLEIEQKTGSLKADDKWTRDNLIFHKDHGLIKKHSWITEEWVDKKIPDLLNEYTTPRKPYYSFFILDFDRGNFRTASGDEFEDSTFKVYGVFMSKNVLLVKLLELAAMEEEFEAHVDKLLGLKPGFKHDISKIQATKEAEERAKKTALGERIGKIKKKLDDVGLGLQFLKPMPYEKDFDERIGKIHLRGMGKERYAPIVNFLKDKFGYGK
jgi:hypothetical protein